MGYWENRMRSRASGALVPAPRVEILPPSPRASAIGFEGASVGRRLRRWVATGSDLNTILSAEGDELRRRSRDLARKNPWAANALDSFVGNCVGTGIMPRSLHPNPEVRKKLQEWFARWTDESDADGLTDFYGQQSMVCRGVMEAGETLIRKRWRRPEDGLFIPLQLQLIESEFLPLSKNETTTTGIIRSGIEFDLVGRRQFYHLYRQHPGSETVGSQNIDLAKVPADSVLHVYKPLRPGQIRGQCWFAPVLALAYEIEQYVDAEIVRKKVAAMITHFITEMDPDGDPINVGSEDEPDEDDTPISAIEPGSTVKLLPGEDVKSSQSADVAGIEFLKLSLRTFAIGLGLTEQQLTGDLSGVNYSSIRAGLLEFRRRCEQFQHQVMAFQMNRPVWRAFIEGCVVAGLIDARDYKRNRQDYLAVEWRPPAWPWVDPLKDVQAKVLEINNRLTSRDAVILERGDDPEQVDEQTATGEQRLKDKGISLPVANNGSTAPARPGVDTNSAATEMVQ